MKLFSSKAALPVWAFILAPVFCFAQNTGGEKPFTVNEGVVCCKEGIPQLPRWFADSRLAFEFDETGISQVDYYNPAQEGGLPTLFLRQLWDGFRNFIEKDNVNYKPVFRDNKIWPFGLESDWNFGESLIKYRLLAVQESIIMQLVVPANIPPGLHFKMEFFEAFALSAGSADDQRFSTGYKTRQWDKWTFSSDHNILQGGFTSLPGRQHKDSTPFRTVCVIGADFPMEQQVRPINPKQILRSEALEPGKTYSFCISFGNDSTALLKKNQALVNHLPEAIGQQFDRYRRVSANSPVLKSPYTALNNFISLAPMYHESLKITDQPGAMRAKTSNYWVWGWDGITSNYATAYWGDVDLIKNMLRFYESTADSGKGIGHAFAYNMKPESYSALPAQGMYISLLQLYYANTRDLHSVKDRYAFAKTIFNRIADKEVAGTGFCEGSSLFPDFPEAMGETGADISGFNNTIFYCAARSMEWLATLTGDQAQQKKSAAIIQRMEQHYLPLFFNTRKQFVVSSVDARTQKQRDSYTINSVRWENNYCADLTDSMARANLEFFKENAVTPMGLREIPLWDKSFDRDANQLHCWWPATGEYFMRLINRFDQRPLIDQWIKWVSYWTNHLTCPEGISYYLETDEPEFDRWTSQKGTWQGYSMRGWYQAALHGVVGVGTDAGGLSFYPYSGEEMELQGLNFQNRKFDISMLGTGPYIDSLDVDGTIVRGTNKLPADLYDHKQRISIKVYRTQTNPYAVSLISGTAVELRDYRYHDQRITATLSGIGFCRLKLNADHPPLVQLNGKRLQVKYDAREHLAVVAFNLKPGELKKLHIH